MLYFRTDGGAEEVNLAHLKDGTGKSKADYSRIRFYEEQARRDSL